MEEKKSGLWWYLLVVWIAFLIMYTLGKRYYVLDQMQIQVVYISFWKVTFVALILSAYVLGRTQQEKIFLKIAILFGVLFLEIAFCAIIGINLKNLLLNHGITGVAAISLGMLGAKGMRGKSSYLFVAFLAVFAANCMPSQVVKSRITTNYPNAGDYSVTKANVIISAIDAEFYIKGNHLFEATANVEFVKSNADMPIFCLNKIMQVDSITDLDGKNITWERVGHYIIVKEIVECIKVHYTCDDSNLIAIDRNYISLPYYLMYYPTGLEENIDFQIKVHTRNNIYCNLDSGLDNAFTGNSAAVSIMGGKGMKEIAFYEKKIVYPVSDYSEQEITNFYMYHIITQAKEHYENKDWFVEPVINQYEMAQYKRKNIDNENYFLRQGR